MRQLAVIGTVLVGLGGGALSAQTITYERIEIASGVHLFQAPDPGTGHITVVVSGTEGLVFDTGTSPLASAIVADSVWALGVRSLRGIVYTHWHMDHILGAQAFLHRYPGTPVIAHPDSEQMLRSEVAPDVERQIAGLSARITAWDEQLASGSASMSK